LNVWAAILWGGIAAGSLCIGQAFARRMEGAHRALGLVMGFGAGALLSAVAYELIPESNLKDSRGIGLAFLLGAIVYFVADQIVDGSGGATRSDIDAAATKQSGGSGAAMFLGALLDGIPESTILGITLDLGGTINVAFLTAVFVSNVPEGIAGTINLRAAGYTDRRILGMWVGLTIVSAVAAGLGFVAAQSAHVTGLYSEAFAAGAVLTMLSNSMLPEGFEHGGRTVGLVVVLGYLVAAVLSVAQ
jgi:ZIP family zinc transporter